MININSEKLEAKIKASGLTKTEIAAQMGSSSNKISGILHGRIYPRLPEIYMLSLILKLSDMEIIDIFFTKLEDDE